MTPRNRARIAAIVVGFAGLAMSVENLASQTVTAPPAEFRIGVGRIGDLVQYDVSSTVPAGAGTFVFEIEGFKASRDWLNVIRPALEVQVTERKNDIPATRTEFLDLQARYPIAAEFFFRRVLDDETVSVLGDFQRNNLATDFVPRCHAPDWRFLLQGAWLAPAGQPTPSMAPHVRACMDGSRVDAPALFSYDLRTYDVGLVGGEPTLGVAVDVVYNRSGVREFLRIEATQAMWYQLGIPYPVRVEEEWVETANGVLAAGASLYELRGFRPGKNPVSWIDSVGPPQQRGPPRVDPGAFWPPAGAASRLAYPLHEAVAAVLEDPTLTEFISWRSANAGARPVGGYYSHSAPVAGADVGAATGARQETWRLTFAAPNGEAFFANTTRIRGFVANGGGPAPPIPESYRAHFLSLPGPLLSFSEAERLWSSWAPVDVAVKGPNVAYWGHWWHDEWEHLRDQPNQTARGAAEDFWHITIVRQSPHPNAPQAAPVPYQTNMMSILKVDARTGSLVLGLDVGSFQGVGPSLLDLGRFISNDAGPPVASPHDRWLPAATVGASLLLIQSIRG